MLNSSIPSPFICWIQFFLNNWRKHVQPFNVLSSSWHFTQGLPQGSVLAPLLFLFYINVLASLLNDDAVIALFADDISILTAACKKEDVEVVSQPVVTSVVIWSKGWKLKLNSNKSEVCSYSTWLNDSTWYPAIFIGTQKVWINTTPCILGVILVRSLTFNAHLKKLTASFTSSIRIIRATALTSWGWHRSTLKMAFHTLVHSKLNYAAPAWRPWLSDTNLSCFNRLQNRFFQLITG